MSIGRVVNLSLSGAMIVPQFDLRIRSRIEIYFDSPFRPKHRQLSLISAYVARPAAAGVGLEWCEFAPVEVMQLLRDLDASRRTDRIEGLRAHQKRMSGQ
jgi:hypothetical protein